MNFDQLLSKRISRMHANILREILKNASIPGVISLAGGVPSPESFPMDIIAALTARVLDTYGPSALQYGPTEGFPPLRESIVPFLRAKGIITTAGQVLVTSGSQGALDAIGKILLSEGDKVALESPTYLGAISAFNPYEPIYLKIDTDEDGPTPEGLEYLFSRHKIKFIYLVPTFQNPTGMTMPLSRRKEIAEFLVRENALLIEDDPYSDLRYVGTPVPSIQTLAPDHVIYLGTFSKILSPGLRVGYCIVPETLKKWMVIAKQGIDLHTSSLSQAIAFEYLNGGYANNHLPVILRYYRTRLLAMLDGLQSSFHGDFSWSKPEGGMFVWVEGPKNFDATRFYDKALKQGVAFVPGQYFHIGFDEGKATMRLNFTMHDAPEIKKALSVLGEMIHIECGVGVNHSRVVSRHADFSAYSLCSY